MTSQMARQKVKSLPANLLGRAITVFITLSVTGECLECYWCGPLAEQVHRSQRPPSCEESTSNVTACEPGYTHCAVVASAPPFVESRYCVKLYQDECYTLYCSTTKSYKVTCPCRGDLCNGPNTQREIDAFKALAATVAGTNNNRISKRNAISNGFTSGKYKNVIEDYPPEEASNMIDAKNESTDSTDQPAQTAKESEVLNADKSHDTDHKKESNERIEQESQDTRATTVLEKAVTTLITEITSEAEQINSVNDNTTPQAMEVTPKVMEVTAKSMEVTTKIMEDTAKDMEVTQKVKEDTSKDMEVTPKVMEDTAKVMEVTPKVIDATPKILEVKHIEKSDNPIDAAIKPTETMKETEHSFVSNEVKPIVQLPTAEALQQDASPVTTEKPLEPTVTITQVTIQMTTPGLNKNMMATKPTNSTKNGSNILYFSVLGLLICLLFNFML